MRTFRSDDNVSTLENDVPSKACASPPHQMSTSLHVWHHLPCFKQAPSKYIVHVEKLNFVRCTCRTNKFSTILYGQWRWLYLTTHCNWPSSVVSGMPTNSENRVGCNWPSFVVSGMPTNSENRVGCNWPSFVVSGMPTQLRESSGM